MVLLATLIAYGTFSPVTFEDKTGDGDMKRMIRKWVRTDGRGDVQVAFGR